MTYLSSIYFILNITLLYLYRALELRKAQHYKSYLSTKNIKQITTLQ